MNNVRYLIVDSVNLIERKPHRMDSRYYPGVEADVSKLVAELRKILSRIVKCKLCTSLQPLLCRRESLARCAILPASLLR
jgi:hypothetical protein